MFDSLILILDFFSNFCYNIYVRKRSSPFSPLPYNLGPTSARTSPGCFLFIKTRGLYTVSCIHPYILQFHFISLYTVYKPQFHFKIPKLSAAKNFLITIPKIIPLFKRIWYFFYLCLIWGIICISHKSLTPLLIRHTGKYYFGTHKIYM